MKVTLLPVGIVFHVVVPADPARVIVATVVEACAGTGSVPAKRRTDNTRSEKAR